MTTIVSNGSRWYGQSPASIPELLDVLATSPLCPSFLAYGGFALDTGSPGVVTFWGNFAEVSHVFNITTDDDLTIERLAVAIKTNLGRQGLSSPSICAVLGEVSK